MRNDMVIGILIGIVFFAAGAILTALAVKYATSGYLWDAILWLGVGLMINSAATLALFYWTEKTGGAFWFPATLLNVGLCVILAGIFYSDSSAPKQDQPAFSWIWDALSDSETQKLALILKDQKPGAIAIACNRRICGKIADSLHTAFRSAGWTSESQRAFPQFLEGISGAVITPDNDASRAIKTAIETTTTLRIAMVLPRFHAAENPLTIIIGGKPPPNPLTETVRAELATLGAKLKQLSREISHLVVDRQAGQALLPKRETFPPDIAGNRTWWETNQDFRQRTEAMFVERFGADILVYMSQLEVLGIERPFGRDGVEEQGKWFGFIGDLLEKGNLIEARERGPDVRFWWGK
jgi:hypothetical protein